MDKEIDWDKPIEIVFVNGCRIPAEARPTRWGLLEVYPRGERDKRSLLATRVGGVVIAAGPGFISRASRVANVREPDITYQRFRVLYDDVDGLYVQPIELTLTGGKPTSVRLMGPSEDVRAP